MKIISTNRSSAKAMSTKILIIGYNDSTRIKSTVSYYEGIILNVSDERECIA